MAPQQSSASLVQALAVAVLAVGCQPGKMDESTSEGIATDVNTSGESTTSTAALSTGMPTTTEGGCADVIAGDLLISETTDVATLACVVEVQGELRVADTTTWFDLTPLTQLRLVGGDLTIVSNEALVNLDGLQALERVGGIVWLGDNTQLADLSGLAGIRQLGGLSLNRNALASVAGLQGDVVFQPAAGGMAGISIASEALTDLDGLMAITGASAPLGLSIDIYEMPSLVDVSGLNVFATVEGPIELELRDLTAVSALEWPGPLESLRVRRTPALQELSLPAMTAAREVSLNDVPALTSLAGLSALKSVSDTLELGLCFGDGLASIVDLQGLEGLEQAALVHIDSNASLVALTGLPETLLAEHVFIRRNPKLPQAAAEAWLSAAGLVGPGTYSEACENLGGPECIIGCPIGD